MKLFKVTDISPLFIIMSLALILNGGFFDDSVAFIGCSILICLFGMLITGKAFHKRDKHFIYLIPFIVLCIAMMVSIWAIDYMDNLMGVMRIAVICLWIWLARSRGQEEIGLTVKLLPLMGCCTVVISGICFFVPIWMPLFWENKRMSGFFQYANTNALFLVLGLIILISNLKEQKRKWWYLLQIILLLTGILLTGSRSILLLLIAWGIWYSIRTVEFRKPFMIGSGALLIVGGLFVALTGNTSNIGRIFTIFTTNSTLWGRLLYDRDAVLVLCQKFFGLGRLGYFYSQGTFQSGIYHIKFAHNDFLQLALDYGVPVLLLVTVFLVWQLFRGKQGGVYKEVLLFIAVASLADFHCQYLFILMLACLCLDFGECEKESPKNLKENYVILPLLLVAFLYVGVATGCGRHGNFDMALSMLPDYTQAQEKKALMSMGTLESYEIAERLLHKNPYNLSGYIARGSFFASQLCVKECIADLDKMLELDPYNVDYYVQYETVLQNMLMQLKEYDFLQENENLQEDMQLIQLRLDTLPTQLEALQDRTSWLAYKIKDKPVFTYK